MQDTQRKIRRGFTLIELLTVIAIIALLIGLLSVGSRRVTIISRELRQKSVFHAMTVGLELFHGDFGRYPDSALRGEDMGYAVTGAQHMAEALQGRDQRGIEPRTGWYPPNDEMYQSAAVPDDLYTNTDASLARRRGPYFELKHGDMLRVPELWEDSGGSPIYASNSVNPRDWSPMITDVFNRNTAPGGGRIGSPILYFKAEPAQPFRVGTDRNEVVNPGQDEYSRWTYNFDDNLPVLQLPWLRDPDINGQAVHYQDPDGGDKTPAQVFYEQITLREDPDRGFFRPHNRDTFILISAGWDGVFGTRQDVTNFD